MRIEWRNFLWVFFCFITIISLSPPSFLPNVREIIKPGEAEDLELRPNQVWETWLMSWRLLGGDTREGGERERERDTGEKREKWHVHQKKNACTAYTKLFQEILVNTGMWQCFFESERQGLSFIFWSLGSQLDQIYCSHTKMVRMWHSPFFLKDLLYYPLCRLFFNIAK